LKECLLYPQERTLELGRNMSALCHKRTSMHLFDHLAGGGKQRLRHGEPECLRGFEIDD